MEKEKSITKVVLDRIDERINKRFPNYPNQPCWSKNEIRNIIRETVDHRLLELKAIKRVNSSLQMKGQKWTKGEDLLLEEEVEIALQTIAKTHARSTGAIRSRMAYKELIW